LECFIVEKENVDLDRRELVITGDEAHHALRSLRIRIGEEILATDLFGICYLCRRVERADPGTLTASIEEILPDFGEPKRDVMLIQGLIAQPSRWEFLLEKATELGVTVIQPVITERTERESFNRERSERILRAAVKQTKRSRMPELREVASLSAAMFSARDEGRMLILLHESADPRQTLSRAAQNIGERRIAIVVGPEGGFSEDEVAEARDTLGAEIVSLGPRRLRAETAALAALAIVSE
jgi:16S rRNA (uracil1498-N3)-methyltransferase